MRGYARAGVAREIGRAGGALFAVTSEPQTLADEARTHWELDFPTVGDPHHEIAEACRARGWLSLFVNRRAERLADETGFAAHPKGYFQPGVLAVTREGRVLYRWRGRPTRRNAGGATGRPLPDHVWARIRESLAAGDTAPDAAPDVPEQLDWSAPPWPVFVALLLANGRFLRPKTFPLARGGPDDVGHRARAALRNLALFALAWILAFALLPLGIALAMLAGWALYVTPGVVALHREFQSVPAGEPALEGEPEGSARPTAV